MPINDEQFQILYNAWVEHAANPPLVAVPDPPDPDTPVQVSIVNNPPTWFHPGNPQYIAYTNTLSVTDYDTTDNVVVSVGVGSTDWNPTATEILATEKAKAQTTQKFKRGDIVNVKNHTDKGSPYSGDMTIHKVMSKQRANEGKLFNDWAYIVENKYGRSTWWESDLHLANPYTDDDWV